MLALFVGVHVVDLIDRFLLLIGLVLLVGAIDGMTVAIWMQRNWNASPRQRRMTAILVVITSVLAAIAGAAAGMM